MINVDHILAEKLAQFSTKHPVLLKPLARFLRFLLHEKEFQQFEHQYPHLEGIDFVEQVLSYFDFQYRHFDRELEHIPLQGPLIVVANHPIGSLDGLALLKLVSSVRHDVKVVANDMLYAIKPLRSLLLGVDNLGNKTRKENIKAIKTHLDNQSAVIVFPAGEVSRFSASGIKDSKWDRGFLHFAKWQSTPILPVFINGRNSLFFYALALLSKPLSGLWLVREMFKQANHYIDIRIGHPVYPEQYQNLGLSDQAQAKLFKKAVYRLAKGQSYPGFALEYESVAHAECRQQLKQEIRTCRLLGQTQDGKQIHLFHYQTNSCLMREIGRLRELTFRSVKEGTGKRRDLDIYDHFYDHIILWDDQNLEIVGAYRLVKTNQWLNRKTPAKIKGQAKFYSQSLFQFENTMNDILKNGLELGRSFVQPQYWGQRSLDCLWFGIGAYLQKNPDIDTLFGTVSISAAYSDRGKNSLVHFYSDFFKSSQQLVTPKNIFQINASLITSLKTTLADQKDYSARLRCLKSHMNSLGENIPTLYKQYSEITELGGTKFCSFNVDPHFADCIDGFVIVEVSKIKTHKRKRYIDSHA